VLGLGDSNHNILNTELTLNKLFYTRSAYPLKLRIILILRYTHKIKKLPIYKSDQKNNLDGKKYVSNLSCLFLEFLKYQYFFE